MLNTSFAGEIEAPPGKFYGKTHMSKHSKSERNTSRPGLFELKAACIGALALICAFITPAPEARADKIPSIVVGIAPLKYLVSSLAGERVMVSVVLPNGGDPHTYEPSAIQMGIISDADYYFSIRQPFEEVLLPKLADAAPQMKLVDISAEVERLPPPSMLEVIPDPLPPPPPANATMLGGVSTLSDNAPKATPAPEENVEKAAAEVTAEEGATEGTAEEGAEKEKAPELSPEEQAKAKFLEEEKTRPDPHIWLSPANMKIMAKAVLDQLVAMLPAYAGEFNTNFEQFIADVTTLDTSIRALLDPLPANQRAFLSFHPSWGYFARDYNLTQIAVELEGYEPSPQLFAKIIEEAKTRHVRTILLEQQFATSLVKTLAEELKANVVAISSLTIAWRENLQSLAQVLATPPETPEGFYNDADNAPEVGVSEGTVQ